MDNKSQDPKKRNAAIGKEVQKIAGQRSNKNLQTDPPVTPPEDEAIYDGVIGESLFQEMEKSQLKSSTNPEETGAITAIVEPLSTSSVVTAPLASDSIPNPSPTQEYDANEMAAQKTPASANQPAAPAPAMPSHVPHVMAPVTQTVGGPKNAQPTQFYAHREVSMWKDKDEVFDESAEKKGNKAMLVNIIQISKIWLCVAVASSILTGILVGLPGWLKSSKISTIPQVRCTRVVEDELQPSLWVHGLVVYEKAQDLVAPVSGQISKVYMSQGGNAKANSLLVEMISASAQPIPPAKTLKPDVMIKMPFDGEISQVFIKENMKVNVGDKLATIQSQRRAVMARIPGAYFSKLLPLEGKLDAKLQIGQNVEMNGKLSEVSLEQSQCWIKVSLVDESQLDKGNIGCPSWIKLTLPEKNSALLVPKAAVISRPELSNLYVVFVTSKQGDIIRLRLVPILIGMGDETNVQVLKGLENDQTVVIWANTGMSSLIENMQVEIAK